MAKKQPTEQKIAGATGQVSGKQSGFTGNTATAPGSNFANQPQATNQAEVDAQDSRTRLWQSMDTTYGAARDEIGRQFDQARVNADNQALSRGMQRSSYNNATLANLDTQRARAIENNYSQQIADYQNRLFDIEQAEQQQANWQAEFDANQAQQAWSNQMAEQQWAAQQSQQEWQNAFSQQQFEAQQNQWREEFDYNKMSAKQQIAFNVIMNALESGDNVSDELLAQAGISRQDYNQMKATPRPSGGGGRTKKPANPENPEAAGEEQQQNGESWRKKMEEWTPEDQPDGNQLIKADITPTTISGEKVYNNPDSNWVYDQKDRLPGYGSGGWTRYNAIK